MSAAERFKMFGFYSTMAWASLLKPRVGREMIDRAEEGVAEYDQRRTMDSIRGTVLRWGTDQCGCHGCTDFGLSSRMVLCPTCGNKRCPKANDHRNACSGSNEPGQAGSAYP